jgi:hypothetical protein
MRILRSTGRCRTALDEWLEKMGNDSTKCSVLTAGSVRAASRNAPWILPDRCVA